MFEIHTDTMRELELSAPYMKKKGYLTASVGESRDNVKLIPL